MEWKRVGNGMDPHPEQAGPKIPPWLNLRKKVTISKLCALYSDKKKIKFSSYIRKSRRERLQSHIWLTVFSYMTKYCRISSYIRKPFHVFDFATAPIWISWNMRKILFYFLSVYSLWPPGVCKQYCTSNRKFCSITQKGPIKAADQNINNCISPNWTKNGPLFLRRP